MIPEPNDGMFSDGSRIGETFPTSTFSGLVLLLLRSNQALKSVRGDGAFSSGIYPTAEGVSSSLLLTC